MPRPVTRASDPAPRRSTAPLWAAVAVLVALHLFPPHGGPEPMVMGALPWDLGWHLLWMAAATAAVFEMTSRRCWPDDPADDAARDGEPTDG